MRTSDGRLKILDFGLARVDGAITDGRRRRLTQPGMLVGTPAYMAPEQIERRRRRRARRCVRVRRAAVRIRVRRAPVRRADAARDDRARARERRAAAGGALSGRCRAVWPTSSAVSAEGAGGAVRLGRRDRRRAEGVRRRGGGGAGTRPGGARISSRSCCCYVGGAVLAWQIKEWMETPLDRRDLPRARRGRHDRRCAARAPGVHRMDEPRVARARAPAHGDCDPADRSGRGRPAVRRRARSSRAYARCQPFSP